MNGCDVPIVRHGLNVIGSSAATNHDDDRSHGC